MTKQSFADKCITKLELGNEGAIGNEERKERNCLIQPRRAVRMDGSRGNVPQPAGPAATASRHSCADAAEGIGLQS